MNMEEDNCDYTPQGEKVVVAGISGRFPRANNVREYSEKLYNKIDMVDEKEDRWQHFNLDVPKRTGKINNLEKFDATFFAIHNRLANVTDPQARILLEHAYEAILDAGISPQSLVGSRTGVFIGCSNSDSKDMYLFKIPTKEGNGISGNANFYIANRISFGLGLCGPSFGVDTACSSSAYALDLAYKYILDGTCDAALVGGSQLVLNFSSTTEYKRLRVLANDGFCRPFDQNASGFTRADAICFLFLQKLKDSKRVYANLLTVGTNNDGFKLEGSAFPSRVLQQQLFEECFQKIKMNPSLISFVEAHSTGTILGDAEEVAAIDAAYCKERTTPLSIGSVKSNIGHTEASSAVASTIKLILALESNKIAPNINLTELRTDIPAFAEGRIKVVTEVENLAGPYVSMNSFGLGGANAHAIFKGNLKSKINNGIPNDNLNRLLCWAGRTEAAVNSIFDDVLSRPLDAEYIALLQNTQIKTTLSNVYRGYGIFSNDDTTQMATCVQKDVQNFNSSKKPVCWIYSGIGSQWLEMGTDLMKLPIFAKSIEYCHELMVPKGLNLKEIITSTDEKTFDNVLHSYVGIAAIEIALTDLMKALGMEPDYIIGHSVGELGCAYCDGCFTAEETMLAAYARGQSNNESKTILGGMAAIGINYKELLAQLPGDIDVACHNAADSTTISGPLDSVKAFVQGLSEKNIFAKEIPCSGVPLHSRYIEEMGKNLLKKLKEVIKDPKKRSAKWLSSTYPSEQWIDEEPQYSSAEYHTKNLISPVLFHEVTEQLPPCVTIEISPHGLLKPIVKRSLKEGVHFSLTQRDDKNGLLLLMNVLGQIFQNGIDFDASKLYPAVDFPVSRGTPMISPIIKWNHSEDYMVPLSAPHDWYEKRNILINVSDKEFEFVQGHVIDGVILLPGTALICIVWETFAGMQAKRPEEVPVTFEEVKFLRATSLMKNRDVILSISIHKGSGMFEITEGLSIVAHGRIRLNEGSEMTEIKAPACTDTFKITESDFYKEMRLRGYYHKGFFRTVVEARSDGLEGKIKWRNNWTAFIDCLLQFQVLTRDTRMLVLPTKFRKLVLDPFVHKKAVNEAAAAVNDAAAAVKPEEDFVVVTKEGDEAKVKVVEGAEKLEGEEKVEVVEPVLLVDCITCPYNKIIQAGGVEIHEFEGMAVNRRRPAAAPVLEAYKFIPHFPSTPTLSNIDMAKFCVQLLLENTPTTRLVSVEIDGDDNRESLSNFIFQGLSDLPMITSDMNYLTTKKVEMDNVTVDDKQLSDFEKVNLVVKSSCMNDSDFLKAAKNVMSEGGFIMSREAPDTKLPVAVPEGLQLVAVIPTEQELVLVLQFPKEELKPPTKVIQITSNVEEWLEPLKLAVKSESVVIYAEKDKTSGILGLFNCVRREISKGASLTCFFIDDPIAPTFDILHPFYKMQLQQGMTMNVFKNNQWGTYRHLRIQENTEILPRSDHCYATCSIKADISSLFWYEGPINVKNYQKCLDQVQIKVSALNFRDVMQASGKITFDTLSRLQLQKVLGHEFAGVKSDGTRVVGLGLAGAFSTYYDDQSYQWVVPDNWTLEEAVTVPLVYCTVYLAFFHASKIERCQSVLIHAGSGGVGIAALHIAFYYGLEVYTTVSTQEKRDYLLSEFPLLKPENIGNSRDTSFETMINVATKGHGVDYVLNSLSEDKLLASIRCLAENGTFLEIGKFDIMNKTKIDLSFLAKKINIKGIFVQAGGAEPDNIGPVYDIIKHHMEKGVIKPLKTTIFEANDIQNAFRYLASGKHIGKVLLKIRENEGDALSLPIAVLPRVFCDEIMSYVIIGGLGGFGLELADWLVLRGCKKLVLSSSRGVTNGYQAVRIKVWKSYGVQVLVSTEDVTTKQGCHELMRVSARLGTIGGIFNLAVALRDGLFENQNAQMFRESSGPKACATKHLDDFTQRFGKYLKHFVVFSSVSCGRGNAGQSNYGMANSVMERIIEQRHELKLPAKAIQWGAVGDVGLLADLQEKNMDMQISGTLPQRITSCFEVLDSLLLSDEPIVASMVVAEKKTFEFRKDNVIESLFNILGIRDKKSISMDTPLSKLGMDSLMTVEIMQLLEREFSLFLTLKELQSMTLYELEQRTKSKDAKEATSSDIAKSLQMALDFMLYNIRDEPINNDTILRLKSGTKDANIKILVIPGIEGVTAEAWDKLAEQFDYDTYILQLNKSAKAGSIMEIHDYIIQDVLDLYADDDAFFLVGYSFGSLLTLEVAKTLESRGRVGNVVMIDGSPLFFKRFVENIAQIDTSDEVVLVQILTALIRIDFQDRYHEVLKIALAGNDAEEKVENFMRFYDSEPNFQKKYTKEWVTGLFNRFKMILILNESSFPYLKSSKISLVVPSEKLITGLAENYNLNRYCSQNVETLVVNGNHLSILQNAELSKFINSFR